MYEATSTGTGGVTLTALDAATGNVTWSTPVDTQTGAYAWGSPMLSNGNLYVTVGGACATSAVHGAIATLDQTTGELLGEFPDGTGRDQRRGHHDHLDQRPGDHQRDLGGHRERARNVRRTRCWASTTRSTGSTATR